MASHSSLGASMYGPGGVEDEILTQPSLAHDATYMVKTADNAMANFAEVSELAQLTLN